MKAQYEAVFTAAVIAKVKAAQEMGIKASWRTQDHLAALAEVIEGDESEINHKKAAIFDILTECYNVSAFQQSLAKKFAATGHFQRTAGVPVKDQADALIAYAATLVAKPTA